MLRSTKAEYAHKNTQARNYIIICLDDSLQQPNKGKFKIYSRQIYSKKLSTDILVLFYVLSSFILINSL